MWGRAGADSKGFVALADGQIGRLAGWRAGQYRLPTNSGTPYRRTYRGK